MRALTIISAVTLIALSSSAFAKQKKISCEAYCAKHCQSSTYKSCSTRCVQGCELNELGRADPFHNKLVMGLTTLSARGN